MGEGWGGGQQTSRTAIKPIYIHLSAQRVCKTQPSTTNHAPLPYRPRRAASHRSTLWHRLHLPAPQRHRRQRAHLHELATARLGRLPPRHPRPAPPSRLGTLAARWHLLRHPPLPRHVQPTMGTGAHHRGQIRLHHQPLRHPRPAPCTTRRRAPRQNTHPRHPARLRRPHLLCRHPQRQRRA